MRFSNKVNKIVYGGDYNPEQWPEEIWADDMRLLKEANIDIVTLNGKGQWTSGMPCDIHRSASGMDGKEISGYPANRIQWVKTKIRGKTQFLPEQSDL